MKTIFIDWSVFVHRAIFAWSVSDKMSSASTMGLISMLSCLYHIGVEPDDTVIVACDSRHGSWRRDYDPAYKANRKEKREAREDIDWKQMFAEFDELRRKLSDSTPFHFVECDRLEADDIISYGVRYYPSQTCVIVSSDSDYEQLAQFSNVRLFSPVTKKYKYVKNPFSILAKKIKREQSDNLTSAVVSVGDYNRRNIIVNLTKLPQEVEESIKVALSNLTEKSWCEELPFADFIQERLMGIYNSTRTINYERWYKRQVPKQVDDTKKIQKKTRKKKTV